MQSVAIIFRLHTATKLFYEKETNCSLYILRRKLCGTKNQKKDYERWTELKMKSPDILHGFVMMEALTLILRFLLRIIYILEKK